MKACTFKKLDREIAIASAAEMSRKVTCEGCAHLKRWPRPMCKGEASPHFRMVRDTYHQRCEAFAVMGVAQITPAAPRPDAPPAHVRLVVRGRAS